jgi:hypothetical protein
MREGPAPATLYTAPTAGRAPGCTAACVCCAGMAALRVRSGCAAPDTHKLGKRAGCAGGVRVQVHCGRTAREASPSQLLFNNFRHQDHKITTNPTSPTRRASQVTHFRKDGKDHGKMDVDRAGAQVTLNPNNPKP